MGSRSARDPEFLEEQKALLTKAIEEAKEKNEKTWEEQKSALYVEIRDKLKKLNAVYADLQRDRQVGDVKYVQFSFLRTGVLLNGPWYRIDLYDENWRIAEVECGISWQPTFLVEPFQETAKALEENFKKVRIARHHYQSMVLKAAKELHLFLTSLLAELFAAKAEEQSPVFFQAIDVYCGEFLDECQQIFHGRL